MVCKYAQAWSELSLAYFSINQYKKAAEHLLQAISLYNKLNQLKSHRCFAIGDYYYCCLLAKLKPIEKIEIKETDVKPSELAIYQLVSYGVAFN